MYHQLLITYIDVRPTRSIRRLIFFAWNDMINFQSLDLCKQLFSNNRREARSAIIFLRYRFDWVKLLKNLVVFSNFLQSLTNGKQKCLDGYICYLPAGRSVLGKTVPEVLSTARGRFFSLWKITL